MQPDQDRLREFIADVVPVHLQDKVLALIAREVRLGKLETQELCMQYMTPIRQKDYLRHVAVSKEETQ